MHPSVRGRKIDGRMNTLTVICPNSHHCIVKVTPSTQLRKVLEEACLKQGFDASSYELKRQNHTLDLALPLRLTGLPNNATLEMVPSTRRNGPSQIQIALQLTDGTRLVRTFTNKINLLDVLHEFSKESGHNLVECGDGKVPSCHYMNREYRGEVELKSTTLEAMGITNGRCLIRYAAVTLSLDELSKLENRLADEKMRNQKLAKMFETRKMENERRLQLETEREEAFKRELEAKREFEAIQSQKRSGQINSGVEENVLHSMAEVSHDTSSVRTAELRAQPQTSHRSQQLQTALNQINTSLETSAANIFDVGCCGQSERIHIDDLQTSGRIEDLNCNAVSSVPSNEPNPVTVEKCNRMAVIIRHNFESNENEGLECMRKQSDEVDDQFFELTVNDVQSIRKDLRAQAGESGQQALLLKAFVAERNKRLKEESYKHTVVRFNFADKTVLQAQFMSREPVSRLYEFITENLKNRKTKFDLLFVNKKLLSSDIKNLIDANVAPKASLRIRFLSSENTFDAHFVRNTFCEIPLAEADDLSRDWLSVNSVYRPYNQTVVVAENVRPTGKRQSEKMSDGAGPSKMRQKPIRNVPKWFRKP